MKITSACIASLASAILMISKPAFSQEAEQANITFVEGSVLVYCTAPSSDSEEHMKVFLDSFPKLIANMQERANNGDLSRAHYLGSLKDGFFFVFRGDTIEQAQSRADALLAESESIISESLKTAGVEPEGKFSDRCESLEVGPLAVKAIE